VTAGVESFPILEGFRQFVGVGARKGNHLQVAVHQEDRANDFVALIDLSHLASGVEFESIVVPLDDLVRFYTLPVSAHDQDQCDDCRADEGLQKALSGHGVPPMM
jgi:hypothetical protein